MRFRHRLLQAPLCLALSCCVAHAQRLPSGVTPEHYTLHLTPDLKTATFAGSETIDVTLAAPSRTIVLNSAEIKMSRVSARVGKKSWPANVSYDEARQQATLSFERALPAGKVELAIEYTGILNDKLRGFYLSKTARRNYAVTQFESTDARRAFPSFDEPALKASFDLSLTIDKGDTVIANTNMLSDRPEGTDKHTQTFATTPRMSTYLLAFQVGDWQCSAGEADGIPIRACATPDKVQYTKYAVTAAEHILHYYDQYFGIKYAMPKLDMIGIPDFEAGAMENWGCITYRETALLVDEKNGTQDAKKSVASVIAHEMAHQWFGDLVTLAWWDNTWLNEGFATWMTGKAVGEFHPEWNIAADTAQSLNGVLNLDGRARTRTIRARADTPDEINQQFDGISYEKAGAVLGMVEHYLGPDTFQQGVQRYLAAHKFGNATAEDFWGTETQVSGKPVDRIMSSFIDQPGEPLLTVTPGANGQLAVSQGRFLLTPNATPPQQTWTLPVCVKGASCTVLRDASATLPAAPGAFVNADAKGYYRTFYAPELFPKVLAAAPSMSAPERIVLIDDRAALVTAGKVPVGDFLSMVEPLKNEPNAQALRTLLAGLSQMARGSSEADTKLLQRWMVRTFAPVYAAMGPANASESPETVQRRLALFSLLAGAEDPEVLAQSRTLADEYLTGKPVSSPELLRVALNLAARQGDATLWEQMRSKADATTDPEQHHLLQQLLAVFQKPELVTRTLDYDTSGAVRNQDSWVLIAIEISNPDTRKVAWPWVKAHWDKVQAQFTESSGTRVVSATGSFCTAEDRADVQSFFETHKVAAADQDLARALQSIDACVKQKSMPKSTDLAKWLATQHIQ